MELIDYRDRHSLGPMPVEAKNRLENAHSWTNLEAAHAELEVRGILCDFGSTSVFASDRISSTRTRKSSSPVSTLKEIVGRGATLPAPAGRAN